MTFLDKFDSARVQVKSSARWHLAIAITLVVVLVSMVSPKCLYLNSYMRVAFDP